MKAERGQEKQAFLAKQPRAETLQVDIEKFQSSVDPVLQVEAERRQLTRDYAIVKGNHQQMLERIEKARLTREVDTSKDLGVRDRPGFIDRLVDEEMDLSKVLLKTDIPKLTILPAGTAHQRSTELLASGTMRRLRTELPRATPTASCRSTRRRSARPPRRACWHP